MAWPEDTFLACLWGASGRCGGISHGVSGKGGDTENQPVSYCAGHEMPFLCATAKLLREQATPAQEKCKLGITEGQKQRASDLALTGINH